MFEVGASTSFRAFHAMPDRPPPEDERHPHDYRVEVVAERNGWTSAAWCATSTSSRARSPRWPETLGPRPLRGLWDRARDGRGFRAWIHDRLAKPLGGDGAEVVAVRVWESSDAFGGIRARVDVEVALLRLALVTLGDPHRRTGGYRYHRMMAAAAADHGADLRFGSVPSVPWPIPTLPAAWTLRAAAEGSHAILLDSIAAAFVAPWIRGVRPPLIAVAHQPPGGLDHGRARVSVQRALDGVAYRSAAGVIVAGEGLIDDLLAIGVAPSGSPSCRRVRRPGRGRTAARPPSRPRRVGALRGQLVAVQGDPRARRGLRDAAAAVRHPVAGGRDGPRSRVRGARRRRISAPDLRDRVVLRGSVPIEEVGRLYRSADVFALSSFADAYGTAWAEALAAGLPVVGWRSSNLPRLADHGREALMAEPGDVAGLHPSSGRSRRIGTCATDSRRARADAPRPSRRGRPRRTGSSPRSAASLVRPHMTADLRAVLFDFDGTLWDSETAVYGVFRDLYEEHGHELTLRRGRPRSARWAGSTRTRSSAACAASPSTSTRSARAPRSGSARPRNVCRCAPGSPVSSGSSTSRGCRGRS